ncbi:MAG: DUF721 domain-containing protein [Acidobacteria bacterium]|nr:DUF721 domain-containing protein [Acidobacteriota bacterium]MXZ72355.1 DUF721 domain-containing protein [Acidobacteriota bacterium]MYD72327.1 DUF721 domain-containing protein [Acidobacteriota bacterium]MYJ06172.1 DUF721 domain-containing protein [Acidobacteriota bacterium]
MIHSRPMVPVQHQAARTLGVLLRRQPLTEAKLRFAWRAAVGDRIDRATTVRLSPGGTLTVRADEDGWGRAIRAARRLIAARLRDILGPGHVKRITVKTEGDAHAFRRHHQRRPAADRQVPRSA